MTAASPLKGPHCGGQSVPGRQACEPRRRMVMRKADQTFYLLDGANEFSGPWAMLWVASRWPALRRELVGARGYIGHRVWFGWPWTIGVTSWWQDEAAAYRFAHLPQHLRLWAWAAQTGRTRGGWLA